MESLRVIYSELAINCLYSTEQLTNKNQAMKLKTLVLTGLTCLSITACTSAPKIPQLQVGVLQEMSNLEVYPDTKNNKAKLTKLKDNCVIEFTGVLENGKVIEQWSFYGNNLMSGGSAVFAKDGTSTATKFDLYDANKQANFMALKNHFHKDALKQCQ